MRTLKLVVLAIFTAVLMQSCMPTGNVTRSPHQTTVDNFYRDAAARRQHDRDMRDMHRMFDKKEK